MAKQHNEGTETTVVTCFFSPTATPHMKAPFIVLLIYLMASHECHGTATQTPTPNHLFDIYHCKTIVIKHTSRATSSVQSFM